MHGRFKNLLIISFRSKSNSMSSKIGSDAFRSDKALTWLVFRPQSTTQMRGDPSGLNVWQTFNTGSSKDGAQILNNCEAWRIPRNDICMHYATSAYISLLWWFDSVSRWPLWRLHWRGWRCWGWGRGHSHPSLPLSRSSPASCPSRGSTGIRKILSQSELRRFYG